MNKISYLPIDSIFPNKMNPRKTLNEEALAELAASIGQIGVLQPITVRPFANRKDQYEIVCGERRYRASRSLELKEIPAIVRELSDEEAMDVMITENLQRKDVNPIEEAEAYRYLVSEKKYKVEDLAARFGKSQSYIYNRYRLNLLIPEFRTLYEDGKINVSHMLIICALAPAQQKEVLPHYNGDHFARWNSLSIAELNHELKWILRRLDDVDFDTSACESCSYNTGCANLFPDLEHASCMNAECFVKKVHMQVLKDIAELREKFPDIRVFSWSSDTEEEQQEYPDLNIEAWGRFLEWNPLHVDEETGIIDYEEAVRDGYRIGYHLSGRYPIRYKEREADDSVAVTNDEETNLFYKKNLYEGRTGELLREKTMKCLNAMSLDSLISVNSSARMDRSYFIQEFKGCSYSSKIRKELEEKYGNKLDLTAIESTEYNAIKNFTCILSLARSYNPVERREAVELIRVKYPKIYEEGLKEIIEKREKGLEKIQRQIDELKSRTEKPEEDFPEQDVDALIAAQEYEEENEG